MFPFHVSFVCFPSRSPCLLPRVLALISWSFQENVSGIKSFLEKGYVSLTETAYKFGWNSSRIEQGMKRRCDNSL